VGMGRLREKKRSPYSHIQNESVECGRAKNFGGKQGGVIRLSKNWWNKQPWTKGKSPKDGGAEEVNTAKELHRRPGRGKKHWNPKKKKAVPGKVWAQRRTTGRGTTCVGRTKWVPQAPKKINANVPPVCCTWQNRAPNRTAHPGNTGRILRKLPTGIKSTPNQNR